MCLEQYGQFVTIAVFHSAAHLCQDTGYEGGFSKAVENSLFKVLNAFTDIGRGRFPGKSGCGGEPYNGTARWSSRVAEKDISSSGNIILHREDMH